MRRLIILVGLLGAVLVGCGTEPAPAAVGPYPVSQAIPTPTSVSLDRLGIESNLVPSGVDPSGAFEIPANPAQASWFAPGPEPGQNGRSLLLGHVNLSGERGVFARLHEAVKGDVVSVGQQGAPARRFIVERVEQQPKAEFGATDLYDELDHPELVLITCGGTLTRDEAGRGNYADNVIVYARQDG